MRPVKTNGTDELALFKKRVQQAHALGRISAVDCGYIVNRIAEIEARVVSMRETDENGEEVG